MLGRKPKPTALHALHGDPGKRRKNARANEPKPTTGALVDAPDWLNEGQLASWRYAIEHAPPGMLAHIDRGALLVWCTAEDLHRRAVMAQNNAGTLLVKAPNTGTPMQSPYLAIINRQGVMMLRAAAELGFSPVSRPRIGAGVAPAGARASAATPRRMSLDDFLDRHPDRETQH